MQGIDSEENDTSYTIEIDHSSARQISSPCSRSLESLMANTSTDVGMGLKGSMFTYSQLADMILGPIPAGKDNHVGSVGFCPYFNDHNAGTNIFDDMFTFLHYENFKKVMDLISDIDAVVDGLQNA